MRLAAALAALILCTAPPAIARSPYHNPTTRRATSITDHRTVGGARADHQRERSLWPGHRGLPRRDALLLASSHGDMLGARRPGRVAVEGCRPTFRLKAIASLEFAGSGEPMAASCPVA
jgi:hypothetical protein